MSHDLLVADHISTLLCPTAGSDSYHAVGQEAHARGLSALGGPAGVAMCPGAAEGGSSKEPGSIHKGGVCDAGCIVCCMTVLYVPHRASDTSPIVPNPYSHTQVMSFIQRLALFVCKLRLQEAALSSETTKRGGEQT